MVTSSPGANTRFFGQSALTARLMLYGLLAVVLMAMDQRGNYVPRIRSLAEFAVEPVYHVVEWPIRALRTVYEQFQSRRSLRRSNDELRRQLLAQQAALQRLETLEKENRRLRALFEGAESQPFEYRFADLLHVDLDPFSHRVLIDQGSTDGVTPGQAVIDGAGVMGQVEDVHPHYASVRLISDPNHALPVQINRTGLRTVAFGTGETDRLDLPNVPRQADVRVGDLIVTSGLGDRFPGGYPVGVVTYIDREEGQTFTRVEARPLAALDRGREVLLIHTPATTGSGTDGPAGDPTEDNEAQPQASGNSGDDVEPTPADDAANGEGQ
ncbi:MAG: rod shape-determining protein MreC, partial [Lysobacterales bacterium]